MANSKIIERSIAADAITAAAIDDATITNAKLANSSMTLDGTVVALGGTATIVY